MNAHYSDLVHSIGDQAKNAVKELDTKNQTNSNEILEEIDTKLNLHSNSIYCETNNSFDNLRDCQKHIFSISKSLFVSSLGQAQQQQQSSQQPTQQSPQSPQPKSQENSQN